MEQNPELREILYQAQVLATASGKAYHSGHILLALMKDANIVHDLLLQGGMTLEFVTEELLESHQEAPEIRKRIHRSAREIAMRSGCGWVTILHLFLAILETRASVAYRIIEAAAVDTEILTAKVTSILRSIAPPEMPPMAPGRGGNDLLNIPRVRLPFTSRSGFSESSWKEPAYPQRAIGGEERYRLDAREYPWLSNLGRNLTLLAYQGKIDPVIGRDREIDEIIDVLNKRRANNPCLIGEPGVGKTAIVEGLARKIVESPEEVAGLSEKLIIELNTGAILAGTQLRGSFSGKMNEIKKEVRKAEGKIIIFIDELHTIIGAGATSESNHDAADELKAVLAQGEFPCIGATTPGDYKKHIEGDPGLERRFHPVFIEEPSVEKAIEILREIVPYYADHHGIFYTDKAVEQAVRLSKTFIFERYLPDKAFAVIDLAGARACRRRNFAVGEAEIAEIVSEISHVPQNLLLMEDTERLLEMETAMGEKIVGHREVIGAIAAVIRRRYAGFSSERPIGTFLFLGPTGVGKTETARVLAEFLFHSRDAMIRIDMSEYMEPHAVARLIGSPPGYVGFDLGGQLTEALRKRPHQIILLDEIEKAHPDTLQLFLQVFDSGRLTDSHGKTVDFSHTVIIMTSNIGSHHFSAHLSQKTGFTRPGTTAAEQEEIEKEVLSTARRIIPIELWNRIDEKIVFRRLTREEVATIARLQIDESRSGLKARTGIDYRVSDEVIAHLIDHGGFSEEFGARPMRRVISALIEKPLSDQILQNRFQAGDIIEVFLAEGELRFSVNASLSEIGTSEKHHDA
ncbi:MAG: ATP-dependent Clp protease ATP-binding subunit [Deltaproteobacteria bacterium]|nr:MAG: ATP-dependent Clp protease ATP-binding subunit [Deltaproteobacteria bacterium]